MRSLRVVVVLTVLSIAASASATEWFVATTGNDTGAGTMAAPFGTITKAAAVAAPGDVVNVRGGVYHEIVKISSRGTATARIVFRSYPGEKAIIDGTGTPAATNLVQISAAEYVDFSGFEVRNATRIGICGWRGHQVRILDNDVHHSTRGGIYFGYSSFGYVSDVTIAGNTVHENVLENQYHTMTGGWAQSIGLQYTDRVQVLNNRVYRNDGEGIVFLQSDNGLARGNEVFDNFSVGIYLDNAQHTTVDANLIYSSGDSRYFRNGYPAAGIGTANETVSVANPLTDVTITNNIIVDTRWGIYYGAYETGGGLKNSTIANNTLYRAAAAMVWLEADAHAGNFIQNNIFHQAGGGVMLLGTAAGTTFRANNWYGGNAGAAAGAGDVIADPRMVNAGGRTAADYRLTDLSPDLQAGLDLSTVTTDYFGAPRAARFDIGAHQFSSVTTAPPPPPAPTPTGDTVAPTTPAGLRVTASTSSTRMYLSWDASTDNVGVAGYRIYRNGTLVATVTATAWTDDNNLRRNTTYTWAVEAFDAAGNVSAKATMSARTKK